jgi:hypothetical protein
MEPPGRPHPPPVWTPGGGFEEKGPARLRGVCRARPAELPPLMVDENSGGISSCRFFVVIFEETFRFRAAFDDFGRRRVINRRIDQSPQRCNTLFKAFDPPVMIF